MKPTNIPATGSPKARLVAAVGIGVASLVLAAVPMFEGTVLKTYRDSVGILTACNGHTGPDVQPGQTFTPQKCEELLVSDLMAHDADISKCIPVDKLTDGQRAAFLSFAFNVGAPKFCRSSMAAMVRAGDVMRACAQLSRWVYAGGRILPGLVKRREHERAMCEGRV